MIFLLKTLSSLLLEFKGIFYLTDQSQWESRSDWLLIKAVLGIWTKVISIEDYLTVERLWYIVYVNEKNVWPSTPEETGSLCRFLLPVLPLKLTSFGSIPSISQMLPTWRCYIFKCYLKSRMTACVVVTSIFRKSVSISSVDRAMHHQQGWGLVEREVCISSDAAAVYSWDIFRLILSFDWVGLYICLLLPDHQVFFWTICL